jgi:two-component system sensor histidine kinase RpfC
MERKMLQHRLVLAAIAIVSSLLFRATQPTIGYLIAYTAITAAILGLMVKQVGNPKFRWTATIIADVGLFCSIATTNPEAAATCFPLLLWSALGMGFRFGIPFLSLASVLSSLAFAAFVVFSDYWMGHKLLGASLVMALLVVPAYSSALIESFYSAKAAEEEANNAKSYFLASISHELRTPLNAIIGYGSHLLNQVQSAKQREMVEASVLAGEHLLHLIDQLIQVARPEKAATQVINREMRATELLLETQRILKSKADDKRIGLTIQAAPLSDTLLNGPAELIRNIVINLTGNAIKFTTSGTVAIACRLVENAGNNMLEFRIYDSGIGIAEDALERIFQPFQQADHTVMDRFGGTGLGLAICKQLCDQVGGWISVDSELGKGSCFTFAIPVRKVPTSKVLTAPAKTQTIKLIAIGTFHDQLLASIQATADYAVKLLPCGNADDAAMLLQKLDLSKFDIALVDEQLTSKPQSAGKFWQLINDSAMPQILVTTKQDGHWIETPDQARFASIIDSSASIECIHSALSIAQLFACGLDRSRSVSESQNMFIKRSVLVVDDNRTNRQILAAILETAGHGVTMACDGDEAIAAMKANNFDIVLMDINMPRMNGIDACKAWREIENGQTRTPILGVTADATAETEAKCLAAGMEQRLTKPVTGGYLLEVIERYCEQNMTAENSPTEFDNSTNIAFESSANAAESSEIIDMEHVAYLQSIGGEDFLREMIESFRSDIVESLEALQSATASADPHKIRFVAHAIKSCANNIGATKLAALSGNIEEISDDRVGTECERLVAQVHLETENALTHLNACTSASKAA